MVTPVLIWYGLTYSVLLGWHHLLQNQISTVRTSFFKRGNSKNISMEMYIRTFIDRILKRTPKQNNQKKYITVYSFTKYFKTLIDFLSIFFRQNYYCCHSVASGYIALLYRSRDVPFIIIRFIQSQVDLIIFGFIIL